MRNGMFILGDVDGNVLRDGLYITVLGTDHLFYVAQKQPGIFQHATFFAGKPVISAGMFVVKNGVLENFISQSGHYKPEKEEMLKALLTMEKMGLDISQFHLIYGVGGEEKVIIDNPKEWQEYNEFLKGDIRKDKPKADEHLLVKIPTEAKLDINAAKLVLGLGGGYYNSELQVVMPLRTALIQILWEQRKIGRAHV